MVHLSMVWLETFGIIESTFVIMWVEEGGGGGHIKSLIWSSFYFFSKVAGIIAVEHCWELYIQI